MSKELMDLVNNAPCCYMATASKDGVPNVTIVASTTAISPDSITMSAGMFLKTFENLTENPKAALVAHSPAPSRPEISMETLTKVTGAQVKGSVSILTSGEIYEQVQKKTAKDISPEAAQRLKAAILLKVEEIYVITPGPDAGKRIA